MTTAQVVETSVTVNDNSPIQDYVNPDDQTQPTFHFQFAERFYVNTIYREQFHESILRRLEKHLSS